MTESKEPQSGMEQPEMDKDRAQIEYYSDVFTEPVLDSVIRTLPKDQRKIVWKEIDGNTQTPKGISIMRGILLKRFPFLKINTAIIKRYSLNEESGAYKVHRDPDEFMDAPLVLITLSGHSTLSIEMGNKMQSITCNRGTTVILKDPTVKHKTTPPQNESGIREFLFFGYSINKPL